MTNTTGASGGVTSNVTMPDLATRYMRALVEIKNLLGPDHLCACEEHGSCDACDGLRCEAAEALHVARIALGLAPDPEDTP